MSAAQAFLRKEWREYYRSWRLWILLIPPLLFAIVDPLFVHFSPQIFQAVEDAYSDIEIATTPPTWLDAYKMWGNNLRSFFPLFLAVFSATTISTESTSGTIIPMITGGLSRKDFVLIKFTVLTVLSAAIMAGTSLILWLFTWMFFPSAPFLPIIMIVGVGTLIAMVLIAMAIFASTFMPDILTTVGLELLIFLILTVTSFWGPARQFSPAGLLRAVSDLATHGRANLTGPAISAVVLTIVLMWMAVRIFERREL